MLRIKELLKEKNMMQKELATAMGVSDVALRQSLKGNPTIGTLQKIADVLGVELWELFTASTSKGSNFTCPNCGCKLDISIKQSE